MASLPASVCVEVLHWVPLLRPASPCRLSDPERFLVSSLAGGEAAIALRMRILSTTEGSTPGSTL